jgi:DNA replication initiation complex subunit (GINS family)
MPDTLGYDDLRKILGKERRTPLLTNLRPDFYHSVSELVGELIKGYEEENRKDPTSSKTMMLHEELRKVRDLGREVYDHRIDKITRMALTAAGGETVDESNLVEGEKEVYEKLVAVLSRSYGDLMGTSYGSYRVADQLQRPPPQTQLTEPGRAGLGDAKVGTEVEGSDEMEVVTTTRDAPSSGDSATMAGPSKEPGLDAATSAALGARKRMGGGTGHTVVQILEDLPPFKGLDRKDYNLKKKDVISLPSAIADNLVKAKKAKHVQVH